MNIEVFKTDKDGTKYILKCTATDSGNGVTYSLDKAEFYTECPDISSAVCKYTYEFGEAPQDNTYEITQEMLDDSSAGINIKKDFVYMKLSETDGDESTDETPILTCTFYVGDIIDQLMNCIDSIPAEENTCSNISKYNSLYMRFKAVALSVRTGDYITAERYYKKFFSGNKPKAYGGCNCHA